MTLLIDGDIILYQACAACENETQWSEEVWTIDSNLVDVKSLITHRLELLTYLAGQDDFVVALSGPKNFRKTLYPEYKANRKGQRKPVGYKVALDWLRDTYPFVQEDNLEADDLLGLLHGPGNVLWSQDKDLKQVPGRRLVETGDGDGVVQTISPAEGLKYFYTQVLTGDPTDNYPGCKGIGEVRAAKILDTKDPWGAILEAYNKAGGDPLLNARMAWILKPGDYNFKTKEVRLWQPTP